MVAHPHTLSLLIKCIVILLDSDATSHSFHIFVMYSCILWVFSLSQAQTVSHGKNLPLFLFKNVIFRKAFWFD